MSLAMPRKRLFSEKPFFFTSQNSVKPTNCRLPCSATFAKPPFRGSLRSHNRHGRLHHVLPPVSPFAVVRLLPEMAGFPFRYPLRVAEAPRRPRWVLVEQQVVSERYSLQVSRNRPAKIRTQFRNWIGETIPWRRRPGFNYRIHGGTEGPAPNLAVDISPVWPACFVDLSL